MSGADMLLSSDHGTDFANARAGARTDGIAADQLRAFVERIDEIDAEIKELNDDKKEIYAEAKGSGFDTKIIKKIVALRRKNHAERMEEEAILALYLEAMGMV